MKRFEQYVIEQDMAGSPVQPGEVQSDPDKPDTSNSAELMAALKEILSIAQKAVDARDNGLEDKMGNSMDDEADDDIGNSLAKPKSDTADSMFGQ